MTTSQFVQVKFNEFTKVKTQLLYYCNYSSSFWQRNTLELEPNFFSKISTDCQKQHVAFLGYSHTKSLFAFKFRSLVQIIVLLLVTRSLPRNGGMGRPWSPEARQFFGVCTRGRTKIESRLRAIGANSL